MFRFPFTNFHELNLDWILSVVKEAKEVFDNGREDIDYAVETAEEAKEIAQEAVEIAIPDDSISTSKLQDNAVTVDKIADYAITSDKIATFAVTTDKIQEGGVTASKIKSGLLYKPNLLDNWYFVGGGSQLGEGIFPINQRGQTSYSNSGYCLDRWKNQSFVSSALSILADCITISTTSPNAGAVIFDQKFSEGKYNSLKGKTITASILVKAISGKWNLQVPSGAITLENAGLYTRTFTIPSDYNNFEYGMRIFNATGLASISIEAVKLELGETQTLAHYENNAWVLNELPDFDTEILNCRRYYIAVGGTYAGFGTSASKFTAFLPLPVEMVKRPTVATSGSGYFMQDSGHSISNIDTTCTLTPTGVQITGDAVVDVNKVGVVNGITFTLSAE